jgi:ankyrin repeat protein
MEKEFLDAVKKGDAERIKAMLAQDRTRVNAKTETGESAILLAMYYGRRGIANLLWDYGAEMNIWDAAAVGATGRVKEHLEREPGLTHAHSHDGFVPLQLAAFFGNADTVEYLASHGADVNAISRNQTFARGVPILQSAVASRNLLTAKILLEHGANVNVINEQDGTPLFLAAFEGNTEMVKLLLAHGADRNLKTKDGQTPLDFARKEGYQEIVALLEHK